MKPVVAYYAFQFRNYCMGLESRVNRLRSETKEVFEKNPFVYCPYFKTNITLNADGLHHLRYSARSERSKQEQILKFSLVPLALKVIKMSSTVQEYRKSQITTDYKSRDGFSRMKCVEYWGFVAITGDSSPIKIRVILRRVGDGKITFWSVMPAMKLKTDTIERSLLLAQKGIEDD